eukprot:scaffold86497_cov26-Prasinocladus_malaysianus.AAC.1
MKRRHWKVLAATTGCVSSYDALRRMISIFAKAWLISDCLHGHSGVVFSFDNLNWVLSFAVAMLHKGDTNEKPVSRSVAMLTGQINQLYKNDCDAADALAFAPTNPETCRPKRKHLSSYKNMPAPDGSPGNGLNQFVLPQQTKAWDEFLSTVLQTVVDSPIDPETGMHTMGKDGLASIVKSKLLSSAKLPPKRGNQTTMGTVAEGSSATLLDIESYLRQVQTDLRVGLPGGPHDILVVGDQQTYALVLQLKRADSQEWEWLHAYPGDWHIMLNGAQNLLRLIWEGGGKDAAAACGLPSMNASGKWRDCHMVILTLWHALSLSVITLFEGRYNEQARANAVSPTVADLKKFIARLQDTSNKNENLRFWSQWWEVATAYVAQYLAVRCSLWHLRGAALHHIAPLFYALRRYKYEELLAHAITDCVTLPDHFLCPMQDGKYWTVSITGRAGASVAVDEAHEMVVNRYMKEHVDRVDESYLVECAGFISHSISSVVALFDAIGFAPAKQSGRPTVEPLAVPVLLSALKPIMHDGEMPLRRSGGGAFGSDPKDLEGKQRASLLTFLQTGKSTQLQYMRQVHMRPVPYERKQPFPGKTATFGPTAPKQTQSEQRYQRRVRRALNTLALNEKHRNGKFEASTQLPLALAEENGQKRHKEKAKAFKWLSDMIPQDLIEQCIQLQYAPDDRIPTDFCHVEDGYREVHAGPHNASTYQEWWKALADKYLKPFGKGATTVVISFDRWQHLSRIREVVHGKRAADAGAGSAVPLLPDVTAGPARGKSLAALLSNKDFKMWLTRNTVAAIIEAANEDVLKNDRILVICTPTELQPVVRCSPTLRQQKHELIAELEKCHTKGEADYAMFLWARRAREAPVKIRATDTDVVFYALALVDGGLLPGKEVVVDKTTGAAGPTFIRISAVLAALRSTKEFSGRSSLGWDILFTYINAGGDYTSFWWTKSHRTWGKALAHREIVDFAFSPHPSSGQTSSFISIEQSADIWQPRINEQAALLFISSLFYKNEKVRDQLCKLTPRDLWYQAGLVHEQRQSDFRRQLEDVLYQGMAAELQNIANMGHMEAYLDMLRRAIFSCEGDERYGVPSTSALRLHLLRVRFIAWHVVDSVQDEPTTIPNDAYLQHGWCLVKGATRTSGPETSDAAQDVVAILWDDICSPPVNSVTSEAKADSVPKLAPHPASRSSSRGCNCKPNNQGECCTSGNCGCRKRSDKTPQGCSSECHCQKHQKICKNPLTNPLAPVQNIKELVASQAPDLKESDHDSDDDEIVDL